jgi:hypothetical protein
MGIFSRESRAEKHEREVQQLFANLNDAKQLFVDSLGYLRNSPYGDVSSMPVRSRPTPEHIKMDTKARKELMLFITDFVEKDWTEVTRLHNETEQQWRRWILNNLLLSLRKYVPMAVAGTEPKIAMLMSQGMVLEPGSRTFYIQRDISSSMDGVGSADYVRENTQVYKHAEYLLLKTIIEILITHLETREKTWLNDASWYYATLFCEYMKWSHLEGPFKNSHG